jgi:hypothetical protein
MSLLTVVLSSVDFQGRYSQFAFNRALSLKQARSQETQVPGALIIGIPTGINNAVVVDVVHCVVSLLVTSTTQKLARGMSAHYESLVTI